MLDFFKNIFKKKTRGQISNNLDEIDFVPLFVFLRRKISSKEKADGVLKKIEEFLKMPHKKQLEVFPSYYLFIEKYLLEIENQFDASFEVLRKKIKELFPDQINVHPSIHIIFEEQHQQELYLKNRFALYVLNAAIEILGAKGENSLINLRDAFDTASRNNFVITSELQELMDAREETDVCTYFKRTFQKIFDSISSYLGERAAIRLFENQYQKLAANYAYLNSFALFIDILPGKVLDEEKINILSKSQIENLLLGKIRSLEIYNEAVQHKNVELELTQQELVEAKEQHKKNADQLSTVLETIAQSVITFDNTGIIIMVNQRVEEMWGHNRNSLIGTSVENLFTPGTFNEIFSNSTEVGMKFTLEVNALKKNGASFPAEMSLSSFYMDQGIYYTAAVHDISLKKIEEQQIEDLLNKIKRNNIDLKNYARVVSHDLKTPIRGIKNIVDWLDEDYRNNMDDQGKEYLDLLKTKIVHMNQMVEGILAYSKAGVENSILDTIDVNDLLKEVVSLVSAPKNFDIQIQENIPKVEAEEIKLKQVFQNLITNAIKYNNKKNGVINISFSENETHWVFSVADNGMGIEEKHHDSIFEVFQTLHPTDRFDSTGIGLSIVKRIVEQHKGKISVESIPDIGSTFTFSISKQLKNERIRISD